jgi:DNA polymerase-1
VATQQDYANARKASRSLFAGTAASSSWQPEPPPVIPPNVGPIYYDTETTGLKWMVGDHPVGYALAWFQGDELRTWYGPTGHAGGNLDPDKVRASVRANLKGRYVKALHTKFDVHQSRNDGVDLAALGCRLGDVGHDAALLNEHRLKYDLDSLAKDVLGMRKVDTVDPTRMAEYHASQVDEYARQDVRLVAMLDRKQTPALALEDLQRVRDLEDACLWPVIEMERNGAPLDMEKLDRWVIESEQDYLRLQLQLTKVIHGYPFNPSEQEPWERLFHVKQLPTNRTPSGGVSTAEEVLRGYDDPDVQAGIRLRKLGKLRADLLKYQKSGRRCGGLLLSSFNQLRRDHREGSGGGTISGRFSSSGFVYADEEIGANDQQVANHGWWTGEWVKEHGKFKLTKDGKKIPVYKYNPRELFIAAKGLYLSADAMQIEFRGFAHYAESAALDAAYAADPRVSFHEVVWEIVKPFADIEYKPLKNTNFAKLYGAGIKKIAYMTGMSEEDARVFVRIYDEKFPDAARLLHQASRLASNRGYVRTILGRRARFPERQRLHKALNGVIQGTAADIMKTKLVELYQERAQTGLVLRMTVHDEVCGDVPDRRAAERVQALLDRQSLALRVPILWDVKTGANWQEC